MKGFIVDLAQNGVHHDQEADSYTMLVLIGRLTLRSTDWDANTDKLAFAQCLSGGGNQTS